MTVLEFERNKMIATVILVAALFTSSAANGPSGSQSYGGYGQQQQLQQQQQHQYQAQDRWYTEASQASNVAQPSASTPYSETPPEETEPSPLPEGWIEHFDPNSGQYYYYNTADGKTSWERPQAQDAEEQGVIQSEHKGEDSRLLEQNSVSAVVPDVAQNPTPEKERQETPGDTVIGGISGMAEKTSIADSSSDESWHSNQHQRTNQPGPTQLQHQQSSWGGQGQSEYQQANDWSATQNIQQQSGGNKWGQSNSTESPVVGGELEIQNGEFQGQPLQAQPQQQGQTGGWGLPEQTKTNELSQNPVEPWGVPKSPEQQHQYQTNPLKQIPPPLPSKETQASSSDISSDNASSKERWGEPKPRDNSPPSDRPPNMDSPSIPRQSWQEQRPTTEYQQRPPVQPGPPHDNNRLPPQQQQPRPHYLQRQYPPYGSYNSNAPPGQGQYDPKYGGHNSYGRGYPPQQPTSSGQLISQGTDDGTSAVKEALSTTWKGLLGFGNRTRDVVGTARDQVVTGATTAGQTLSARSSSIWESAKSTVGGVFENDSGSQPPYSLSGHTGQPPQESRSLPNYEGRPAGPHQGYPNVPGGLVGRGPPPRNFGGPQQQPGRFGPPMGQQPRHGPQNGSVEPPGRQQPPAPQQHMKPPGYPNMQPRRDHPYPQMPKGQERGPMQSQYGNQSISQQPPKGLYQAQQRPPYSGPTGAQPNRGTGMTQGTPHQEKQDPWDHPALTGEY